MVVVTVDMWPGGDQKKAYRLGRTYIYNIDRDGLMPPDRGNYRVIVAKKGCEDEVLYGAERNICRRGVVDNYPRLAYNMWRLVIRALKSAFPEEGK